MRPKLVLFAIGSLLSVPGSAATTEELMNVMTVCGVGSNVTISSTTQERAQLIWQEGAAAGETVQDIAPKIGQLIFGDATGAFYKSYVECMRTMLQ